MNDPEKTLRTNEAGNIDLSIIVVSFNTAAMTHACLTAVLQSELDHQFELVLYDNASTDNTRELLATINDPRIRFVFSDVNYGFAGGNNRAAELCKGDKLLLLNPDTVVDEDAIAAVMQFSEQEPAAGIWGGWTKFADGSPNPTYCWANQSLWSLVSQSMGLSSLFRASRLCNPEGVGYWNTQSIRKVDIVSGCFFLTTRALWDQLKGFDESFFIYGEEADFCNKVKKLGYSPMVTKTAMLIHHGGASEESHAGKLIKLLAAKAELIRRYKTPLVASIALSLLWFWPASRAFAHTVLSYFGVAKSKKGKATWLAVCRARVYWWPRNAYLTVHKRLSAGSNL